MEAVDGSPSPTKVHFTEELPVVSEPKIRRRMELTQKYDRKEIQRRLDIEKWMDEKLKEIYQCEDDSHPMFDLDDVLSFEPSKREERLKEYLKDAILSPDDFIQELLQRAATFKTKLSN